MLRLAAVPPIQTLLSLNMGHHVYQQLFLAHVHKLITIFRHKKGKAFHLVEPQVWECKLRYSAKTARIFNLFSSTSILPPYTSYEPAF